MSTAWIIGCVIWYVANQEIFSSFFSTEFFFSSEMRIEIHEWNEIFSRVLHWNSETTASGRFGEDEKKNTRTTQSGKNTVYWMSVIIHIPPWVFRASELIRSHILSAKRYQIFLFETKKEEIHIQNWAISRITWTFKPSVREFPEIQIVQTRTNEWFRAVTWIAIEL